MFRLLVVSLVVSIGTLAAQTNPLPKPAPLPTPTPTADSKQSTYHEVHQGGKFVSRTKTYEEAQKVAENWEKLNKEKGTCTIKGPFIEEKSTGTGDSTTKPMPEPGPTPTIDLEALKPDKLKTISERQKAYYVWKDLLKKAGGKAADIQFPSAAGDVSGQLTGLMQDWVYFNNKTQQFLNQVNDKLYRLNSSIFDKLRRNPEVIIDPLRELPPGLVSIDELKNPPKTPFEFDIRMVQAEQRMVTEYIKELKEPDKSFILKDLNDTFDTNWFESIAMSVLYGSQTGWAVEALGTKIDFENEKHRKAIGYAMIFAKHGFSKEQYLDFMKTGKLPKKA